MLSVYLGKNLIGVSQAQPYMSRSIENYRLPHYLTSRDQNSLFYKGLKLYNSAKNLIGVAASFTVFKKSVKSYVKDNKI